MPACSAWGISTLQPLVFAQLLLACPWCPPACCWPAPDAASRCRAPTLHACRRVLPAPPQPAAGTCPAVTPRVLLVCGADVLHSMADPTMWRQDLLEVTSFSVLNMFTLKECLLPAVTPAGAAAAGAAECAEARSRPPPWRRCCAPHDCKPPRDPTPAPLRPRHCPFSQAMRRCVPPLGFLPCCRRSFRSTASSACRATAPTRRSCSTARAACCTRTAAT